jgi:hypothetical protein
MARKAGQIIADRALSWSAFTLGAISKRGTRKYHTRLAITRFPTFRDVFSAAAGQGAMNRAIFVTTKLHGVPPAWFHWG